MDLRKTGIEAIGEVPWGTHFCQFYATKDDLSEILVPYFKAGLENDEFCMWVTSSPLGVPEAWSMLGRAVPELESYRERGRIEIIPHTEWYRQEETFLGPRVLQGWVDKLESAVARGCAGLRVTGNTFWLEKSGWKSFAEYESAVDAVLARHRILALCTYSLDRCGASEVTDVIRNHGSALVKRDGVWELFEGFDRRRMQEASESTALWDGLAGYLAVVVSKARTEDALRRSELRYRAFFENLRETVGVLEADRNEQGEIVDWIIRDVNEVALPQLGRSRDEVIGRRASEVFTPPTPEQHRQYRRVLETGEPSFHESAHGDRHYLISVFRLDESTIASSAMDITDRKRMEDALHEADRRKDEFLAVLSHELRNPLAPITNSLYVLDHAVPGGDEARHAQTIIDRQVRQLTRLVDDLLDVTRIASNKIRLQRERLELNDLVRRTIEDHRSLFAGREVALEFEPAPGPVCVDGDWSRLGQSLGNLLQNAVKFTGRGGRAEVSVSIDSDGSKAVLHVADTGVGMTPEVLSRLFQPFMQADTTLDRSKGGLGLGLALVKGIVELHGGAVRAHSAGLGHGAEFILQLPLDPRDPGPVESRRETRTVLRRRVLIIEDNIDAAESLRLLLSYSGHEIAVAYNGPEGIAKAREFRPEILLCDIGLPGMDGYQVAREFRAENTLREVSLVALSGYASPDDLQRAAASGFDLHIAKPPNLKKLQEVLSDLPRQRTS